MCLARTRKGGLPPATALIVGGIALAFVPGIPAFTIEPDLVLVLFLPQLLMDDAYFTWPGPISGASTAGSCCWRSARLTASRYIGVVIPWALFAAHAPGVEGVHGLRLAASGPEAHLLGPLLMGAVAQAPRLSSGRASALGQALVGLIGACLGEQEGPTLEERLPSPVAELASIARHIQLHAADPTLDPDRLRTTFGLSRAGLYRLFRPSGGVADAIRRRRAEIAHGLLTDPRTASDPVETVAGSSGFSDERSLRRAIRDVYGTTPSQLRRASSDAEPTADPTTVEIEALFDVGDR